MFRRTVLAAALLLPLTAVAFAAPANADPLKAKNSGVVQLWCDNGNTYVTVVNGNGDWTPAHDLSSTSMLIPLSFGEVTFTVRDSAGNLVDQQTEPPTSKGSASNAGSRMQATCDFAGGGTDPESGMTFDFSGTVVGFVTPGH